MASVIRHPKSRFWTGCYTDRNGKRHRRSTKSTNKRQATRIATEWEDVERKSRQSELTTTQLQKVFSDISESITGESLKSPSAKDYLSEWLRGVAARNAELTHVRYQNTVKIFLDHLGARAEKPITSLTTKHFDDFMNSRLTANIASQTVSTDLKILKSAFKRALDHGYILKNPVTAVQLPKVRSSEREIFTPEEIQKMLDVTPSLDWQTLILLGFFTGARLSDCVHLKWDNVHPDKGVIIYEPTKTERKVIVPMHYHIIEHLNYLSKFHTEGYLCPALAAKGPGGKHGLSESFKRIAVRAGLDLGIIKGKGVRKFTKRTFHSLRHSFNSALANAGVPEEIRMKLTGHTTRSSHVIYTHLEMNVLKNAVTAIPLMPAGHEKNEKDLS